MRQQKGSPAGNDEASVVVSDNSFESDASGSIKGGNDDVHADADVVSSGMRGRDEAVAEAEQKQQPTRSKRARSAVSRYAWKQHKTPRITATALTVLRYSACRK
eukprot:6183608-Pleurochrysis_carterae.AAC.3